MQRLSPLHRTIGNHSVPAMLLALAFGLVTSATSCSDSDTAPPPLPTGGGHVGGGTAANGGGGTAGGGGGTAGGGGGTAPTFTWTELTASADTQRIYLSSSAGSDSNDCRSEATACATLSHGVDQLRDGYPDWLLLKRGDQWEESFSSQSGISWRISGRGEGEPMVISSYGDTGPRPLIKAGQDHGFLRQHDDDVHDLALVGLHFKAHTRDPYSAEYQSEAGVAFQSGFRWTAGGQVARILVENCKFEFFKSNFAMHPSGTAPMFEDVRVRGNVFYSAWTGSTSEYSQGIYADRIDGLLIEGNVFDRNGGLVGFTNDPNGIVPSGLSAIDVTVTWFNHQAYIQSGNRNVDVRNNIFANGDGMQLRPGGIAVDNLFTRCINSLSTGSATEPVAGGVSGTLSRNVFLEGTDFAPESDTPGFRAHGIGVANVDSAAGLVVEDNIFARDMSEDHYGSAISASGQDCGSGNAYPCPVHNLTIQNNITFDWRGGIRLSGVLGTEIGDITVVGNILQCPSDDAAPLMSLNSGFDAGELSFAGGRYDRGGAAQWFRIDGSGQDFAAWVAATGETGAEAAAVSFTDSTRTLADYSALQGGAASHDAFMERAREQEKDNWDPAYEAVAVNAYFREGFTVTNP